MFHENDYNALEKALTIQFHALGYLHGIKGLEFPDHRSPAYQSGFLNGRNEYLHNAVMNEFLNAESQVYP